MFILRNLKYSVGFVLLSLFVIACSENNPVLNSEPFKNNQIKPYNIILFLDADCPLCRAYKPVIKMLNDSLGRDSWNVFVIRPDLKRTSQLERGEFGMQTGDADNFFSHKLQATVTPEAFILGKNSHILYQGAIDNYSYETGKHRSIANEFYLWDAITDINNGRKVKKPYVEPAGCYIE